MIKKKNCCEENGDIITKQLRKKLKQGKIDIDFLNQTLKGDCEFVLEEDEVDF